MPNKRSKPWIRRWSRPIMAGLASIGAAVTAYLTYTKLTGNEAACPTQGCDIVLSSPYANIFGLPLALFGFLAYASMVVFAIAPLVFKSSRDLIFNGSSTSKRSSNKLESWTGVLLFIGATAMTIFSGYLMYLLVYEIKAVCIYCVASALLSTSLFALALAGREWEDTGGLVFTGFAVGMLVLISTLGWYANIKNPNVAESGKPQLTASGYLITTTSGEAEIALAKHLKQTGAVFYGSFTCPHCHDQKQLFGKEAVKDVPYVECNPQGANPRTDLCQGAKVKGFPTWVIKGKSVTGTQKLEELAKLSGYKGLSNFKNPLESLR